MIDFGTSFFFEELVESVFISTPEFMPPEILHHAIKQSLSNPDPPELHPWSLDIWSFGIMLLELIVGIPIYMSYKCCVTKRMSGENVETSTPLIGLLASSSREPEKLLKLINQRFGASGGPENLSVLLRQFNSQFCIGQLNRDEEFIDFLGGMLQVDPIKRSSPSELLSHQFL